MLKKVSVPERKEISSRLRETGNGELHGHLGVEIGDVERVAGMVETIHGYKVYGESVIKKDTVWKIHT